jgi:ubiquinone/menaquinone biosynthesis C-methylase UbiE
VTTEHRHGHDEHGHGHQHVEPHGHEAAIGHGEHPHAHGGHEHGHGEHGHGHGGHEHGFNVESLRNNDSLYADVYRQIIDWLAVPHGAAVLEAGSGAGGFTQLLAEAVVPNGGSVTALDESHEMLDATRDLLERGPHGKSVRYQQGDIGKLPFDAGAFDLAWSSRTIHHLADQLAGVRELARVLKPSGRLVLREGSIRTRFLPDDIGLGEPGLEDRLDVAYQRWFASNVRHDGVRYPYGWLRMLAEAGLSVVTARTFMLEAIAPFTDVQISYMGRHLRRWIDNDERRGFLLPGDADILAALVDPMSEHFVFSRTDLYLHEQVTVYVGTKA